MQHLIVPIDGSDSAWRAVDTALALARRVDASVEIFEIVFRESDVLFARDRIQELLGARACDDVDVSVRVALSERPVADEIASALDARPDATVVMASHGRGRSAGVIGSVAADVVQQTFGPTLIVGPHAHGDDFGGPIVVAVDGSEESEAALPLAAAWGIELGVAPWIVHVSDPITRADVGMDVMDTAYPARLAHELQRVSGHRVEFDELHDGDPDAAVPGYAQRLGASLIVATSHGRSGLSRLALGSTTASFIRHGTCPVLVARLPHRHDHADHGHHRRWVRRRRDNRRPETVGG